LTEISEPQVT